MHATLCMLLTRVYVCVTPSLDAAPQTQYHRALHQRLAPPERVYSKVIHASPRPPVALNSACDPLGPRVHPWLRAPIPWRGGRGRAPTLGTQPPRCRARGRPGLSRPSLCPMSAASSAAAGKDPPCAGRRWVCVMLCVRVAPLQSTPTARRDGHVPIHAFSLQVFSRQRALLNP